MTNAPKDKPHHLGHRDRVRQRFIKAGAEGLADYELLEVILFSAIPRRDVKPLAKELITTFGTLGKVITASVSELEQVKGISTNTAVLIKTIQAAALHMLGENMSERPVLSSWQALLDYLHLAMAYEKNEQFRILFLNRRNELLLDEVQQRGTVDHAPVYPREIVKKSLEVGATAIILVHNHPTGDPEPSEADIRMTKDIIRALAPLDITVHDHLIVGKGGTSSFKSQGLI